MEFMRRTSKHVYVDYKWKTFQKLTRQAMYVQSNIKVRSCNRFCSGKAINITQPVCVFVALGIQHAILSSVACPALQRFFHIIS